MKYFDFTCQLDKYNHGSSEKKKLVKRKIAFGVKCVTYNNLNIS